MEKRPHRFKKHFLENIDHKSRELKTKVYLCNNFYEFFIESFKKIRIEYRNIYGINHEIVGEEKSVYLKDYNNVDGQQLKEIIKCLKDFAYETSEIVSSRGKIYLFLKLLYLENNESAIENAIAVNSPTGNHYYLPSFLLNNIDGNTYTYLNLESMNLNNVETIIPKIPEFSFAMSNIDDSSYSSIGLIYFFSRSNTSVHKIDIIDLLNNEIAFLQSMDRRPPLKSGGLKEREFRLFQLTPTCYQISLNEIEYAGYLREKWTTIQGEYNFLTKSWINLSGNSALESLK